jgi:hypothetical protein
MRGFRKRLGTAIQSSEQYRDKIWALSVDAGLGKKTLYNTLNDEGLDVSQTGPGMFGMARVARLLGVSLDYLAGNAPPTNIERDRESSQALVQHITNALHSQASLPNVRVSADGLLRLYAKSGGKLEGFHQVMDQCDQYTAPEIREDHLTVIAVGSRSLSAITMGTNDRHLLQQALITVSDEPLKKRWLQDYRQANERGYLVTIEELNVQMPNHPVLVKMEFLRVLIAVDDHGGKRTILNFSLLMA